MAILDRKKLAAFAGKDSESPSSSEPASSGDDDMLENGKGRFGMLIPMLEKYSEEIEECGDELDPDVLEDTEADLSIDDEEVLAEGMEALDSKLRKEMKVALADCSMEQAEKLAEHLGNEAMTEDVDRMAAVLYRMGQVLKSGSAPSSSSSMSSSGPVSSEAPSSGPVSSEAPSSSPVSSEAE